jgi:hypothetical protein
MSATLDNLMMNFLCDIKFKLLPRKCCCGRCKYIFSMDFGLTYRCLKNKGVIPNIRMASCALFETSRNWHEE